NKDRQGSDDFSPGYLRRRRYYGFPLQAGGYLRGPGHRRCTFSVQLHSKAQGQERLEDRLEGTEARCEVHIRMADSTGLTAVAAGGVISNAVSSAPMMLPQLLTPVLRSQSSTRSPSCSQAWPQTSSAPVSPSIPSA